MLILDPSLNMSTVNHIFNLQVNSSLELDCSSAGSAWLRAGNSPGIWTYQCNGYGNPSTKKPFKLNKMGLGLGLSCGVFFTAVPCILFWLARRNKRSSTAVPKTMPPAYEPGPPPIYLRESEPGSETHLEADQPNGTATGRESRSMDGHEREQDVQQSRTLVTS